MAISYISVLNATFDGGLPHDDDERFVTNFSWESEFYYRRAIAEYLETYPEDVDMFIIKDDAFDVYGQRVERCKSFWVKQPKNLTSFWKIFDRVSGFPERGEC
ncbi:MAG: hypothetical protein NC114_06265 [Ruminococcus flavefaciens]|nr:hypothetical protein [Ruminococcus flavefaciens]